MVVFPNAKINLGLNVLRKRKDRYHDIHSVFYPVYGCTDILEIIKSDKFIFNSTGITIPIGENSCIKAWRLLKEDFNIGNVYIHLHKQIPIGSGLGGGSSDASFTLKLLNKIFNLKLSIKELEGYAIQIGSDCPFFIENTSKFVEGRGENMTNINLNLSDFNIHLIHSNVHISSEEAYREIIPEIPETSLKEIIQLDIKSWEGKLKNDFEDSVFLKYPKFKKIKKGLYEDGALYASMTGSGSTIYSISKK